MAKANKIKTPTDLLAHLADVMQDLSDKKIDVTIAKTQADLSRQMNNIFRLEFDKEKFQKMTGGGEGNKK